MVFKALRESTLAGTATALAMSAMSNIGQTAQGALKGVTESFASGVTLNAFGGALNAVAPLIPLAPMLVKSGLDLGEAISWFMSKEQNKIAKGSAKVFEAIAVPGVSIAANMFLPGLGGIVGATAVNMLISGLVNGLVKSDGDQSTANKT